MDNMQNISLLEVISYAQKYPSSSLKIGDLTQGSGDCI